jgi:hypothetical protein
VRAGRRVAQQAGVVHAGGHHADAPFGTQWQQFTQAGLVEQGVPAGEHEAVEPGIARLAHEPGQHRRLVHASADRADGPGLPEICEGTVRAGERLVEVVVGIVDVQHVHPI